MNWRGIRAVIRKDLTVVLRSRMILLPMIILPLILQVLLPVGLGLAANMAPDTIAGDSDLMRFFETVPPSVLEGIAAADESSRLMLLVLIYVFAPLFLITPMMVSSVIAADSFVGERERKTLEALLHTPLNDLELVVAKMLAAWLAAAVVTLGSFVLYAIAVNVVGWPAMGRVFFPNALWLILVLWVAPAVAGTGLGATVLVSARVSTFQEAYQLGAIVVVPIVALVFGQIAGVVFLSLGFALGLGLILWIVDAVLLLYGARSFRGEELLARL